MTVNWKEIADLIRLKRPIGVFLLLFPCWWGLIAAGQQDVTIYLLFALGAWVMRSAGCIINDLMDRHYDRQVERTRHRPLAAGRLSVRQAMIVLTVLLSVGACILLAMPLPVIIAGIIILPLIFLYPLCKRWTNWPQVVLGIIFNWGIVMGWLATSTDISPDLSSGISPDLSSGVSSGLSSVLSSVLSSGLLALYAGGFFWTLYYDTIYAIQDREGDRALGLGSSAQALGKHLYAGIEFFQWMMLLCWAMAGWLSDMGWGFWFLFLLLILEGRRQMRDLRRHGAQNADYLFRRNSWSGAIFTAALALGHSDIPYLP